MKGSQFLLEALKGLGIKYIFGIFGREAQAILGNEVKDINFILTRHEFTAGIMAEVYARLTGKPQVCWSTFGPGATNLATAIASAYLDRSPLIAISAQVEIDQIDPINTHQCLDQKGIFQPITKLSYEIKDVNDIANKINSAFDLANIELKGPVFLSIPTNILTEENKDTNSEIKKKTEEERGCDNIHDLYKLLQESQNPLILVGNEAIRTNISKEFKEFIEKYKIPVLTTSAGKSIIPEDHQLSLGVINKYINGILGSDVTKRIFSECDLLIVFGYDYVEDVKPLIWSPVDKKKVIRISSLENKTEKYFKPDLDVIGNLKIILKILNRYNFSSDRGDTFSWFTLEKEKILLTAKDLSPEKLISIINQNLDKDSILVSDIGIHKQYAALLGKVYSVKSFLCSNGLGSFGFALPAAMAAKLAHPEKNIIAIAGDGGFHSGSQDLETAVRYNLPITIIVVKDGSFGLIKHYQVIGHGKNYTNSVDFGNVDFVKLAEANGCEGYRIESYDELPIILKEKPTKPRVIEVPIEYNYSFGG